MAQPGRIRSRPFLAGAAVVVLLLAAAVAYSAFARGAEPKPPRPAAAKPAPKPPPPPQAADRHVAPGGNDSGACGPDGPCASFARAYTVAGAGEVVEVAGGRYGAQELPLVSRPRGKAVRFRPVRGERVVVAGGLEIFGRDVEIANLRIKGWHVKPGADRVTLRRIHTDGRGFISSASNVRVIGGSIGPVTDDGAVQIKAASQSTVPPRNVLFEGVDFHDFVRSPAGEDESAHVDCLHVMAVDGMVLRGNTFRNCEAFNVLFTRFGEAGSPRNVLIENNFFSCCRSGFYSVALGGGHRERWKNFTIRHNSTDKPFNVSVGATDARSAVRFEGNVGPGLKRVVCGLPGVTSEYNVWARARCSRTDRIAPSGFRDPARGDLHLRPGAAAIGRGHPRSAPARDIDGEPRPSGAAPDAGADEAG